MNAKSVLELHMTCRRVLESSQIELCPLSAR